MFGKTIFLLRTILFWGLLTVTLVESVRQKKDVHHMIFLNESRRPSKNNRPKDYHNFYKEKRPSKPRKRPGKKETILEDNSEESSHEEFSRPQPKSKRHHHKHHTHNHQPSRNQKRHNKRGHQNNHKKYHKEDNPNHNHHGSYKPTQSKFPPGTESWIPMSSKEFFDGEHQNHQYFRGNGLGHRAEGFIQSIPMEITTPLPIQSINTFYPQSTIYPPLSLINQNDKIRPQPPFIGTVEPYKPFDYSILEQKPQHLEYQEQDVSASNVVNVKHKVENGGSPSSIIIENSRETVKPKKQEENDEQNSEETSKNIEKSKEKRKRTRGGSRYRITSKN